MANIYELLEQINSAIYGEDVRGSIHDAIEQCYEDATGSPSSIASLIQKFVDTGTVVEDEYSYTTELTTTERELGSLSLSEGVWILAIDVETDGTESENYGLDYRIDVNGEESVTYKTYREVISTGESFLKDSNYVSILSLSEGETITVTAVRTDSSTERYMNIGPVSMTAVKIAGSSSDTPVVDNKELAVDANDYLYLT